MNAASILEEFKNFVNSQLLKQRALYESKKGVTAEDHFAENWLPFFNVLVRECNNNLFEQYKNYVDDSIELGNQLQQIAEQGLFKLRHIN